MFTFHGSLRQFDDANYAYRCEIDYKNVRYIIWKESGNWWRLEYLYPYNPEPLYARYSNWKDLEKHIPPKLLECEDWIIFNYFYSVP